ncbi:MAG: tetratricopeptide repeat protein [Candidatus Caldarchaeum sp.]
MYLIPALAISAASVHGTVVFPFPGPNGTVRSIAFVRGADVYSAKIDSSNQFAIVGIPPGEYGVQLRNGTETLVIGSFTIEARENQIKFYFPAILNDEQRFARAKETYEEGLRFLHAREYSFAENRLTESLQWDTGQSATWAALALAQVGGRRYEEALLSASMAAQLAPGEPTYQNNLGGVLFRMGKYDEAEKRFLSAANLVERGRGFYLANAGATCWRSGKEKEALAHYEQAVADATVFAHAWFFYGVLCEQLGNQERARHAYTTYLSLEPNGEWAREARRRLQAMGASSSS